MRVKYIVALSALALTGLSLALGQSPTPSERSLTPERISDTERLNQWVRTERSLLLIASNMPWVGLDRVLADGLRNKTLRLRILTPSAEVPRWREWAQLGAQVRGHRGGSSRASMLVGEDLSIVIDAKAPGALVFTDLQSARVIAKQIEPAWQYAQP